VTVNVDIPSMTLLSWLVVGVIAGYLASAFMGMGISLLGAIVLGVLGAILGGWLAADVFHVAGVTGVNVTSIIVAAIGAMILIAIFGGFGRRSYYRRRF
jgi:uncharacterized membrane protein YeaQ/YmgE (transglycosylase-associated protein family)